MNASRSVVRIGGATVAGFALMVVSVLVIEVALMQLWPQAFTRADGSWRLPHPLVPWYAANLAYSTLAAVAGGWVAARIAGPSSRAAVATLVALLLISNLATLVGPAPDGLEIPVWWTLGELAAGLLGVFAGAAVRANRAGRRAQS